MRHAEVCPCRDCGMVRLNRITDEMPDTEGKLVTAFAAFELSKDPMLAEQVALPYTEVLAVVQRIEKLVASLDDLKSQAVEDPHSGPMSDLIESIQTELKSLTFAWRRE